MIAISSFEPYPSLVEGKAHAACSAVVIIPARNEEHSLDDTLDSVAAQTDGVGRPLKDEAFEILLLLNNCTDRSGHVATRWKARHPRVRLHIVERTFRPADAHIGMARRLLMDTAWHRLSASRQRPRAILSTDCDTLVSRNWIQNNLDALRAGADVVGGAIHLKAGDLQLLPVGARKSYLHDRRYQQLVARLEDLLDPQPGDPWPRHLENFGASLACSREIYARAGGLPPLAVLEDVAFVKALGAIGAQIRHEPSVKVHTSARFDGRVSVGLSSQLRLWQQMYLDKQSHCVPSATWLKHRFTMLRHLRSLSLQSSPRHPNLRSRTQQVNAGKYPVSLFLHELDRERLISETYKGVGREEVSIVNRKLLQMISAMSEPKMIDPSSPENEVDGGASEVTGMALGLDSFEHVEPVSF